MTNEYIRDYIEQAIINATEKAFDDIESKFGIVDFTTDEHGDFANAQGELIFAIFSAVIARKNATFSSELESALSSLTMEEKIKLHELYVNYSEAYDTIYKMEDFNKECEGLTPMDIAQLTSSRLFDYTDKYYAENEEHGLYSFTDVNFGELPFDGMTDYIRWIMNEEPRTGIESIDDIIKKWRALK